MLPRRKRTTAEFHKHDLEYSDGLFLGICGISTEPVTGTTGRDARTRDVRVLSDPESTWNGDSLLKPNTSFEQYIDPSEQFPDRRQIETGVVAHDELPPEVDISTPRRRTRLAPSDFVIHCYTAGCGGCVNPRLRRGRSINH